MSIHVTWMQLQYLWLRQMVRFGRKAGQAQNAPAANAQMNGFLQNAQANGFVQAQALNGQPFNAGPANGRPLTAQQREAAMNTIPGITPEMLDAYGRGDGRLIGEMVRETDEDLAVGQQPGAVHLTTASGFDVGPDGTRAEMIYVSANDGTEFIARVPEAPAPAPAPVEDECVFQPQHVVLERDINIASSAPRIVDSSSDVCGNLLSYREQMTRTMTAGPWVPTSGMNGSAGQFVVEDNGEVSLLGQPGADIANSAGFGDITWSNTNTGADSMGSRYLPNGNNAQVAGRRRGAGNSRWAAGNMHNFRSG